MASFLTLKNLQFLDVFTWRARQTQARRAEFGSAP
jgi:hypothetical protein